jgi:hypothetical protein
MIGWLALGAVIVAACFGARLIAPTSGLIVTAMALWSLCGYLF